MKVTSLFLMFCAAGPLFGADQLTGFPFQNESLRYQIKLAAGANLGEATVSANKGDAAGWNFEMSFQSGLPGVPFADTYQSKSTAGLCSNELHRQMTHGLKKVTEKTTFDQKANVAQRQTLSPAGGGKSELKLPVGCARDALAYFFYARQEMGQGRVPQPGRIFFGNGYDVRVDYTGAINVPVNGKDQVTDHVNVYIKGPASDITVEVFYARDAARTPLLIKVPVPVGKLTLELVK